MKRRSPLLLVSAASLLKSRDELHLWNAIGLPKLAIVSLEQSGVAGNRKPNFPRPLTLRTLFENRGKKNRSLEADGRRPLGKFVRDCSTRKYECNSKVPKCTFEDRHSVLSTGATTPQFFLRDPRIDEAAPGGPGCFGREFLKPEAAVRSAVSASGAPKGSDWLANRVFHGRLEADSRRYYRSGWRFLDQTKIAGMRIDQITKDEVEKLKFPGSASNGNNALDRPRLF
jgi:hypothetical protein